MGVEILIKFALLSELSCMLVYDLLPSEAYLCTVKKKKAAAAFTTFFAFEGR